MAGRRAPDPANAVMAMAGSIGDGRISTLTVFNLAYRMTGSRSARSSGAEEEEAFCWRVKKSGDRFHIAPQIGIYNSIMMVTILKSRIISLFVPPNPRILAALMEISVMFLDYVQNRDLKSLTLIHIMT